MSIVVERASERGLSNLGWLKSAFSYSFAEYHNRARMGFGSLRVFNDDSVAPLRGFGMHPHADMEIVTILLKGEIAHEDSMGHKSVLTAPSIQKMSAGMGVYHSEFNASADEELELFQIWIKPHTKGLVPIYEQRELAKDDFTNKLLTLAEPDPKSGEIKIFQNAKISRGYFLNKTSLIYELSVAPGVFVFVAEGAVSVCGERLLRRDSAEITMEGNMAFEIEEGSDVVVIEA
ncbi:MAG TPA: pirin family protein [Campylobacterales bacterium]|nr:pirin family protein [Campylobacterales bacterium]